MNRTPQTIEDLANRIVKKFIDVSADDIVEDVRVFFDNLVEDGFVASGETVEECEKHDIGFRYELGCGDNKDFTPAIIRTDIGTRDILGPQMLKEPRIGGFQFETTSKCNERCIHCYIPHENKTSDINPDLFYRVLDELEEMGVINVTLSGGEPLMHPEIVGFLRAAKRKDFNVGILSNLTLLTDEIVDVLKDGNPSFAQVSLYSMIPEHHDAITSVKGSHNLTMKGILKLIENNVPVQINCPIMKINKDDYVDVKKWAHEHKIRSEANYLIMAEYDRNTSNLVHRLNPQECRDFMKEKIQNDKKYQDEVLSSKYESEIEKLQNNGDEAFCGVGISTCCMVANGDVFPCPGWQSMVCGNLYEDTLENIWKNSKELNYLRSIRKRDISECMSCDKKAFCSPCLVRFANESPTGNPLEVSEYFCKVAEVNKEVVDEWRRDHIK